MINNYSEKQLADIIKDTRLNMKKHTQDNMAEQLELSSRQAYANIENGESKIQLKHIIKLCEIFECDIGYLFGEYPTKRRVSSDVQEVTGLSETSIEYLLEAKKEYDSAKLEYDKADNNDDKLSAENKFLVSGIKLQTLNFILENDETYGLLDLIGRYLFGMPIFRNDIDETAELYTDISEADFEKLEITDYLQKCPINYLYQFDVKSKTTFPILDFISTDEIYASLLVQLNNKLSEIGNKFREDNQKNFKEALNKYLKENYPDDVINQILD